MRIRVHRAQRCGCTLALRLSRLDAFALEYAKREGLCSGHDRVEDGEQVLALRGMERVCDLVAAGRSKEALEVAKSGIPELLRDSCISFKMQKQVVLELATQSQDQSPAGATEFLKLLTQLAQSAHTAYPEAFNELKQCSASLVSGCEEAERFTTEARNDLLQQIARHIQRKRGVEEVALCRLMKYLCHIHLQCAHPSIDGSTDAISTELLSKERDPPVVSSPVDMSVEKVSRVDMFNLITHIGVTSEAARLTLAASGGDVAQALSTELGRMRLSVRLVDDIVSEYCLFRRLFPAPNGDHEPERATDHVALEEGHSERSIGDMMCCKGRPRGGDGGGGGRGSREGALGAGERGGDAWRWVGEESMAKGAVLSRVRRLVEAGDFLEAAALVAGERHATGRRGGDFGVPSPAQEDPAEAGPRPQGWGSVDEDGVASAREEALAVAELELLRAAVLSILHRKLPLEQALSVMRSRAGPLAAQWSKTLMPRLKDMSLLLLNCDAGLPEEPDRCFLADYVAVIMMEAMQCEKPRLVTVMRDFIHSHHIWHRHMNQQDDPFESFFETDELLMDLGQLPQSSWTVLEAGKRDVDVPSAQDSLAFSVLAQRLLQNAVREGEHAGEFVVQRLDEEAALDEGEDEDMGEDDEEVEEDYDDEMDDDGDVDVSEDDIRQLMEVLAVSRTHAIELLAQCGGSVEEAINSRFEDYM